MVCKNCETQLGAKDRYCKSCGGKVIKKRLTFRNLFEHISETFFNYDNKLLRTFIQLFKTPEDVIDGYISGVRKKYINPISFFGLSLTISGLSIFILKKFYIEYLDFSSLYGDLSQSSSFDPKMFLEYNSLMYVILIPSFAFLSWITFFNKKHNFTEHIIIYLYSMSLISIVSAILGQITLFISPKYYMTYILVQNLIMFLYHCYILKRIFELSVKGIILKTLLFLSISVISYIALILATIVIIIILKIIGVDVDTESFKPPK